MKTQIIPLDPNEDHISVRDKMIWSQAGRILLVWPDRGRVLNRRLDLTLVLRHADHLGAQLALVTQDTEVRYQAKQLGISVFDNPKQAQEAEWAKYVRIEPKIPNPAGQIKKQTLYQAIHASPPAWLEHPATKAVSLAISLLALLSLGIMILPGARISLSPQVETQSMVFDLIADPSTSSINYSTESLPTYLRNVVMEGHQAAPATGSVAMAGQPAMASLRFYNYSDRTIHIPVGTIVSTAGRDPVRFITTNSELVDVAPETSIYVPAQAMKPGFSGNMDSDELVIIAGALGQELTVTNPEEASGGTQVVVPSPSENDLTNLRRRLSDQLSADALEEIKSSLPEGDILISPATSDIKILEETVFPAIGEPGNQLELSLQLRVQSYVVSRESLHALINPIMDANTPDGYHPRPGPLTIVPVSNFIRNKDGKVTWNARVSRQLQVEISGESVMDQIRGSRAAQASLVLSEALPLAKTPDIKISPGWWPWLPFVPMRIEFLYLEAQ